jgi:basic membrane lipoprotein Med (substrate-binding protein (PBP1-ABC) superfamily)
VGIIFQHSLPVPGNDTGEYGLYDFTEDGGRTVRHYGAALWHWGSLYLRIIENILSGSSDGFNRGSDSSVPENFWGGLRSGTVDFTVNPDTVPLKTRLMINLMRENLMDRQIHPFTGPIYDNKGVLRIPEGGQADLKDIRNMNWLCEGVEDLSREISPDLLSEEE